jgi:hypothetical protein
MPESPTKISEQLEARRTWGTRIVTWTLLGGLGATAVYFWGLIVPFLIDAATNTIKLAGLCAAVGAILWIFFDPKIRTLVSYAYSSAVHKLLKEFVDIDPIGALNTFVERTKERVEAQTKIIGSLQGQRNELAAYIDGNEKEREMQLARAAAAKKIVDKGGENAARMRSQLKFSGNQAGRLLASTTELKKRLERIDVYLTNLKRIRDASSDLQQNIEAEVKLRTENYRMMNKSVTAIRLAQKIMEASGPEKEIYDTALESVAQSVAQNEGEIEYFMERVQPILDGADLDNLIYEDSAVTQLEDRTANAPPAAKVRVAGESSPDEFGDLFDDKNSKSGKA